MRLPVLSVVVAVLVLSGCVDAPGEPDAGESPSVSPIPSATPDVTGCVEFEDLIAEWYDLEHDSSRPNSDRLDFRRNLKARVTEIAQPATGDVRTALDDVAFWLPDDASSIFSEVSGSHSLYVEYTAVLVDVCAAAGADIELAPIV